MFQDYMFSMLEGDQTIFSLSEASNIPVRELYDYFKGLKNKGLVELSNVSSLDVYQNINPCIILAEQKIKQCQLQFYTS